MTLRIDPSTFDPFKSNKDQTPEAKLKIVKAAAKGLVLLVGELRDNVQDDSLCVKATNYLNHLVEEEIMEFINEE